MAWRLCSFATSSVVAFLLTRWDYACDLTLLLSYPPSPPPPTPFPTRTCPSCACYQPEANTVILVSYGTGTLLGERDTAALRARNPIPKRPRRDPWRGLLPQRGCCPNVCCRFLACVHACVRPGSL